MPHPPNTTLPIIHGLIELYKNWHEVLSHFPSSSRHTLGFRIDTLLIETAELLFSASFLTGYRKLNLVEKSSSNLDAVKFLMRLAWEIKSVNNNKYIILSEQLEKIGKQIGGWLKQLKNSPPLQAGRNMDSCETGRRPSDCQDSRRTRA